MPEDLKQWLIKMVAFMTLLTGGSEFSQMARQSLLYKAKLKAKETLEFGKKIIP